MLENPTPSRFGRMYQTVHTFLLPFLLAFQHFTSAVSIFVRLRNPPLNDEQLLERSTQILTDGRCALKYMRSELKRRKPIGPYKPTSRAEWASIIGAAVAYLGVATYVLGYMYYSTLFDRLLPGMDIEYPYLLVLEATYRKAALLIVAFVPALVIASRYISPDFVAQRATLREASRYAFLASVAAHEIRRRNLAESKLKSLYRRLRNFSNDVVKQMPDGWWAIATSLQFTRFRLIWVELAVTGLVTLLTFSAIWLAYRTQAAVYQYDWAVTGAWYVVGFLVLQGLLVLLASIIAGTFYILLLALEAHYHKMPGKLIRRRVVVTMLALAVLVFAVEELGRSQGRIQAMTYSDRFPRVAVLLEDRVVAASGRPLLAEPVKASDVTSNTVVGHLVPVSFSDDYFLLVPSSEPKDKPRLARIRIPAGTVSMVTRSTGTYDEPDE